MSISFFRNRPNLRFGDRTLIEAGSSIANGMIGCWLFNEVIAAAPGYSLCLPADKVTLTSVTRVNNQYGNALSFNGSSSYGKATPLATRFWQAQPISVRAIVNFTSVVGYQPVIDYVNVNGYYGWDLCCSTTIQFYIANSAGGPIDTVTGRTGVVGTWYDIIATDNGTTLSLYVNGILDNTHASGTAQWTSALNVYWGSDRPEHAGPSYLTGLIAHTAVWNRCLTASEVKMLYTNPYCFLYAGAPFPSFVAGKPINQCAYV